MNPEKSSNALNTFAFDFFRILCNNSTKNELISPFSILSALNMCLLAAKNNTEKELFEAMRYKLGFKNSQEVHTFMQKFLEFWDANKRHVTLNIANRVLVNKSDKCKMNAEYSKQLKTFYKAMVDEVNFAAENAQILQTCNKWVNEATKGKIPTILDSIEKDAKAVLMNAIYFKGSWVHAFDKSLTKSEPFFNFGEKDKAKNVPLMYQGKVEASMLSAVIDGEELQMVELPYKGNVSFSILMTKSINGLKKILSKVNCDVLEKMKFVTDKVNLWLPNFKAETKYSLVPPLKEIGIKDAFSGRADFSGMRTERDIYISQVVHKAAIEVNEEGTVAAAATAVTMVTYCAMIPDRQPVNFRVDHPFAYFLKDSNSGIILFIGKVDAL